MLFASGMQIAFGQGVTTAFISGRVLDEKGEGLPGATVIAVHIPSGTQYATAATADGSFNLPAVRVGGPYTITATFVGYKEQKLENIMLSLGQNYNTRFVMVSETQAIQDVVITAKKDAVMNIDRTGAATNISNEIIRALPTLNRSLSDYTRLTPQANTTGQNTSSFGGRSDRYNNFTVDGSAFNNAFGLSGAVGGQTNANPISLDAIEEVQINLAPYDVRQGMFTGAGVNAITRAGTNEFKGSVYTFLRNQEFVGKKVGGVDVTQNDFNQQQYGFRLGGPVIKNKLFFFVNAEANRRSDPATNFIARRPGVSGDNVANVDAFVLDELRNFLITNYNYNPGSYENYQQITYGDNATARIDWNISNQHRLNIRYNYLRSYRDVPPSGTGAQGGRAPSRDRLPFSGSWYRINNNMHSVIAELNSTFSNKLTNNLIVGHTAMRDFRESTSGPFPTVDIENGSNQTLTTFGFEPFSANNKLDTDVTQISDNLTYFAGKHTITGGFAFEFYRTLNGFMQEFYGRYRFNTVADFYASALSGVSNATQYALRSSNLPGVEVPLVKLRAAILGFYAQDEFKVSDYLKLTAGLRVDVPTYDDKVLPPNRELLELRFLDNQIADVSKFAKTTPLLSPRIGFNWDPLKNGKLQVRGGTGLFTGRVPFVWISNQASNNGVIFATELQNNPTNRPFTPSINPPWRPTPTGRAAAAYNVAITDRNFKIPQVFRSNIAADYRLPNDWIVTAEVIYTKDINAVYTKNINLPEPTTNLVGADNRPRFTLNRINPNISDAILLANTTQGYQFNFTLQLQKAFSNGFFATAAYNYGDARDISPMTASIASSNFAATFVSGNPNEPILSYSSFFIRHRFIASLGYEKEYLKNYKTSIGIFFEGRTGDRYSYTVGGDPNNDGFNNDLMFIPARREDIILVPVSATATATAPADTRSPETIWAQLDAYINQDPYLSKNRGKYANRNGLVAPWFNRMDVRITQDFKFEVAGKPQTIQLSLDVFNFLNMINSNWGVERVPVRTASLLSFQGLDPDGRPRYTFPFLNAATQTPVTTTFQNSFGLSSRWQAQFGIRYIFN